jgi:hypothetical protein
MPTNVVKTKKQEELWNKAKARASSEGKSENYAYIMGIFKNMGGLNKSASVMLDVLSKEAGFVGKVLGKNVGKVEKDISSLKGKMSHTKDTMNSTKGWLGRKFSDSTTRRAMKPDYEKMKNLKGDLKTQKKETFKARAKTVGGAAAIGAGVAGAKTIGDQYSQNRNYGNNDELKPQYLASDRNELIEKTANLIIKEASLAGIGKGIKDIATLKGVKASKAVLDAASNPKINSTNPTVLLLRSLKDNIIHLKKTNQAYVKGAKSLGEIKDKHLGAAIANARNSSFADKAAQSKKNKTLVDKMKNVISEQQKVIDAAESKFSSMYNELVRLNHVESSKAIGLYGGAGAAIGGTAYGVNKLRNKQET